TQDRTRGVRRGVHHLGPGILVLAFTGERYRQRLTVRMLAHEVHGRVFHGHLGTDIAVDPLHGGALFTSRALGHQVVDVIRPVLDGRVAAPRILFHVNLDDGRVQGVGAVDRGRAALHVMQY